MRPEFDNVLQSLTLNGYSVFSLINDILTHNCNLNEDLRIKLLREGTERDTLDICARLLSQNPASASVSLWVLGAVQSALRAEDMTWKERGHHFMNDHGPLSLRNNNFGRVQFRVKHDRHAAVIDKLPDNVFLEMFNFCLGDTPEDRMPDIERTRNWQRLVHICQRWRRIIFESPRHLYLHLSCSSGTPVRENLIFWPVTLPLTVDYDLDHRRLAPEDDHNMVAALKHPCRVHRIRIFVGGSLMRKVATLMQRSFPALTFLDLEWDFDDLQDSRGLTVLVFPSRFLGGSAPNLQYLRLKSVSFPGLPTFLLSARNLVTLKLKEICQNGYISPEAMVGSLALLTRLTTLSIAFCDEASLPEQRTRPTDPPMRTILPSLTDFRYRGCSEYISDFLAQIDTPRLENLRIKYFIDHIRAPQLSRFIDRTEFLRIDQSRRVEVGFFSEDSIYVGFDYPRREGYQARLSLKILGLGWLEMQILGVVDILGQLAAVFPNVDHLYLFAHGDHAGSEEIGLAEWLPFFSLFPAVESLHLSGSVATFIASVLEDNADSEVVADVLSALHLIWLDEDEDEEDYEPVGSIERFLSSRQLSGRPVTVVNTQDEFLDADRRPIQKGS